MKNKVTRQTGTGGMCVKQSTNTGSGSRPKGSRFTISSSNPARSQQIRPPNKIDNSQLTMAKPWKPVSEKYFGAPLANGQGCDEPRDPAFKERFNDGQVLNGRGSQGMVGGPAGSKPTPQRTRGAVGYAHNRGSYPSRSQKLRG